MRCRRDGSGLELVAWGVRNAYGLGFLPDGRLLATDQGADDRGSRPIGHAPDVLYEVKRGAWYGWPDFVGGRPVDDPAFRPTRGPHPSAILANHDTLPAPEKPLLSFAVNAAAAKFAVLPPTAHRWPGQLLVALFGDEKPMTAPPGAKVGRTMLRVDPADWSAHPVALPPGLERPIDVAVSPDGRRLWVLDFGRFEMLGEGRIDALAGSGAVCTATFD
jgi:glucose/arabinose dehydrogenase